MIRRSYYMAAKTATGKENETWHWRVVEFTSWFAPDTIKLISEYREHVAKWAEVGTEYVNITDFKRVD